jgi:hypothetical protein
MPHVPLLLARAIAVRSSSATSFLFVLFSHKLQGISVMLAHDHFITWPGGGTFFFFRYDFVKGELEALA